MLPGEELTEVLLPDTAVVFFAQQPWEMARSWSSFCLDSPVQHPRWARAQDLLSTWEMLPWLWESKCGFWVREGRLLPYFSCNHRELDIHCVVATSAEILPTQAACTADVQADQTFFRGLVCVTFSSCLSFDHHQNMKKGLAFFVVVVVVAVVIVVAAFLILSNEYCDVISWIIRVSYSVLQIVV